MRPVIINEFSIPGLSHWYEVEWCTRSTLKLSFRIFRHVTSLRHQEGRRVYWEGSELFKPCPTHFTRGGETFLGWSSPPLPPLVKGLRIFKWELDKLLNWRRFLIASVSAVTIFNVQTFVNDLQQLPARSFGGLGFWSADRDGQALDQSTVTAKGRIPCLFMKFLTARGKQKWFLGQTLRWRRKRIFEFASRQSEVKTIVDKNLQTPQTQFAAWGREGATYIP